MRTFAIIPDGSQFKVIMSSLGSVIGHCGIFYTLEDAEYTLKAFQDREASYQSSIPTQPVAEPTILMCAMCASDCSLTGIIDGEVLPLCDDACFWNLCRVWSCDGSFSHASTYDETMAAIFMPAPLYPPLPEMPCYENLQDILGYSSQPRPAVTARLGVWDTMKAVVSLIFA